MDYLVEKDLMALKDSRELKEILVEW